MSDKLDKVGRWASLVAAVIDAIKKLRGSKV